MLRTIFIHSENVSTYNATPLLVSAKSHMVPHRGSRWKLLATVQALMFPVRAVEAGLYMVSQLGLGGELLTTEQTIVADGAEADLRKNRVNQ